MKYTHQIRFVEEQKSLKQQYDGLMSRQQTITSEMESAKNKMAADLEAMASLNISKKNTILEKIQDLNHVYSFFSIILFLVTIGLYFLEKENIYRSYPRRKGQYP